MCQFLVSLRPTPSCLALDQGVSNLRPSQLISLEGINKEEKQVLRTDFMSFASTESDSTQTTSIDSSSNEFHYYDENERSSSPSETASMAKSPRTASLNNSKLAQKALALFASSSSSSSSDQRNTKGFHAHGHDEDDSMSFSIGQRSKALQPEEWEEIMPEYEWDLPVV